MRTRDEVIKILDHCAFEINKELNTIPITYSKPWLDVFYTDRGCPSVLTARLELTQCVSVDKSEPLSKINVAERVLHTCEEGIAKLEEYKTRLKELIAQGE